MDGHNPVRRRKACDFCVSRKIRCDSLKPVCTNCHVYGAECRMTIATNAGRRRAQASNHLGHHPPVASIDSPQQPSNSSTSLESRLAHIEAQLAQLVANSEVVNTARQQSVVPASSGHHVRFSDLPEANSYQSPDMWHEGSSLPCLGLAKKANAAAGMSAATCGQPDLPPLAELLPVVDNYFNTYNQYIPLFDQPSFMRIILDLYSSPHIRDRVPWAAVNLVLAITYRLLEDRPLDDPVLAQSIQIVQSATTDLMAWDKDLLGLQVLLGMVFLFQGTNSPQLAIVLIGSSIRLIQSMGLPSQKSFAGLSPSAALHRRRIFWIAYILDRDLALRAKAPYTQIDAEMDLEFPEDGEDSLGILTSKIDGLRFNYLRARVELAHIQGKTHDLLYSKRARKLSEEQKQHNIQRIDDMLRTWRESIPEVLLTADGLRRRLNDPAIHLMTNMLNRHLECIFRLHSMYSFEITWLNRVRCYLSPGVIELRDDMDGEVMHSNLAPLPGEWAECVKYCRLCLELLSLGNETEHAMRLHACCELSSLIVLLVNIIENPDHEFLSVDQNLIDQTRELFERLSESPSENKFFLLQIAQDLDRRARGQVNRISEANDIWFLDDMGDC